MTLPPVLATILVVIEYVIKIAALGVIPENRRPSSSSAWLLLILFLPLVGFPLYWLIGSPRVHGKRYDLQQAVTQLALEFTEDLPDAPEGADPSPTLAGVLRLNRRLTGLPCVTGVVRGIHADPHATYAAMARAVDAAEHHVHVEFYIMAWDEETDVFFSALARAVERGVTVRLLLDHLGSRKYPGWRNLGQRLSAAGIQWHLMMPLLPLKGLWRRPDLRNHRKVLVVDSERAFVGSHNVIEPTYRNWRAPGGGRRWEDLSVEVSGQVVVECEAVFAMDWYFESGERLAPEDPEELEILEQVLPEIPVGTPLPAVHLLTVDGGAGATPSTTVGEAAVPGADPGPGHGPSGDGGGRSREAVDAVGDPDGIGSVVNAMQLVPSGPGYPSEPNLRMFISLIHGASRRITITSPYFIPDEALLEAITSAALRGVDVQLFVGQSSDQFLVSHAQRSYYATLLAAGVRILLYPEPAVLHSKYMTVDDQVGVIGSSNMDFRSFALNYELMLLCFGGDMDDRLRANDELYRARSRELTAEEWAREPRYRRWVDNVCRLAAAVL